MDWRDLERQRRLEHPEIRGVSWVCEHSFDHDPTDARGPVRVVARRDNVVQFHINRERRRGFLDAR